MRRLFATILLVAAPPALHAQPAREVPIEGGVRTPIPRQATEQREVGAGIAVDRDREAQQLRDLNALSRQLAPGAPTPAPDVDRAPPRR